MSTTETGSLQVELMIEEANRGCSRNSVDLSR